MSKHNFKILLFSPECTHSFNIHTFRIPINTSRFPKQTPLANFPLWPQRSLLRTNLNGNEYFQVLMPCIQRDFPPQRILVFEILAHLPLESSWGCCVLFCPILTEQRLCPNPFRSLHPALPPGLWHVARQPPCLTLNSPDPKSVS